MWLGWGGASLDIQNVLSYSCTMHFAQFFKKTGKLRVKNDSCEDKPTNVWGSSNHNHNTPENPGWKSQGRPGVRWIGSPAKAKIGSKTSVFSVVDLRSYEMILGISSPEPIAVGFYFENFQNRSLKEVEKWIFDKVSIVKALINDIWSLKILKQLGWFET